MTVESTPSTDAVAWSGGRRVRAVGSEQRWLLGARFAAGAVGAIAAVPVEERSVD